MLQRIALGLGLVALLVVAACGDDDTSGNDAGKKHAAHDAQAGDGSSDMGSGEAGDARDAQVSGADHGSDAGMHTSHSGTDGGTSSHQSDSGTGGAQDAGTTTSSGATKTSKMIGAAGGTVTIKGVKVEIPPGALAQDTPITIEKTSDKAPKGLKAYSPLFKFGPDGQQFSMLVTISIDFTGDDAMTRVYWTSVFDSETIWDDRGGTVDGHTVSTQVPHFSSGFAGDVTGGTCIDDYVCRMGKIGTEGWYCCGTGAIKNCVDTNHDEENCDGCGVKCEVGKYCTVVGSGTSACLQCTTSGGPCSGDDNDQCCSGSCTGQTCD
jgi:hypothetical protein